MIITIEQAVDILQRELRNLDQEMLDHLIEHDCYFDAAMCPEYACLLRLQQQWQQRVRKLEETR